MKTSVPTAAKRAVVRRRLLDLLDSSSERRLIVLKAPAGYGKTTLAAAWCQRLHDAGAVTGWLSLDSDDNEPGAFAYHLTRACECASSELAAEAMELLQSSSLIPPKNVVSALVNAATEIDKDIYLLFDDFHVVTDNRCHELVLLLLRYAPSNLHVVVLTRTEPPLSLSRLRLEDQLVEIDASLLHFDREETEQLLGDELCRRLRPAGVTELLASTEGWPAALQLTRISLRNSEDPGAHIRQRSGASCKISEFIEDTLASLPEDAVRFLLETSILHELSGPLCDAVTCSKDCARMLRRLEREQFLVIPLDEGGNAFRYHHLMRDYLTGQLEASMGDRIAELNRRAYVWYAAEGMWTEAVQHAIAAKDFDKALQFVENCAMTLVVKGDLLTLLSWERQLPAELMSSQLEVKLALSWGMALVTRFKEADDLLAHVEAAAESNPGSDLWWRCRSARAILFALKDDSARGRDLAAQCLEGYAYDRFNYNALCNVVRYDTIRAGDWSNFAVVPKPKPDTDGTGPILPENYHLCLCGMAAAQQLKCDEALKFYEEARQLAVGLLGPRSVSATMVAGLSARIQYERGDVQGAEISVLDQLDLIESTSFHEGFLQAFLVLVRAAVARGESQRALGYLNRAERLSWERGWHRVVANLLVERMRLCLAMGSLQEATPLLQALQHLTSKHGTTRHCSNGEILLNYATAMGLLAEATGHTADAIDLLQSAYDGYVVVDNRLSALRVGLDLAMARARSDKDDVGLLKLLLQQASEARITALVRERPDVIQMLSAPSTRARLCSEPRLLSYIDDLTTDRADAGTSRQAAATRKPQVVTAREKNILEFIAKGQSNKEIARELGVAPETVKTHMKRIFQKLSAETRAQAVVRAQSLGLLQDSGRPTARHTAADFSFLVTNPVTGAHNTH